nr:hypothetical protein CFP56_74058 [Quercus suber]
MGISQGWRLCCKRDPAPSDISGAGEEVLKAEQFLEAIIKAPEEEWNKLLINGMTVGKGDISPDEFYAVIKKRIERTLIRTEGGSYQQRVLTEYLKGIQSRAEEIVQVLQGKP